MEGLIFGILRHVTIISRYQVSAINHARGQIQLTKCPFQLKIYFMLCCNILMNRLPKALNERNNNNLTTSKKTLEEELFPLDKVGACTSVCENVQEYNKKSPFQGT